MASTDGEEKRDARLEDFRHARVYWFWGWMVFLSLVAICVLTYMLLAFQKSDLITELIKAVALFAGGFGSGIVTARIVANR